MENNIGTHSLSLLLLFSYSLNTLSLSLSLSLSLNFSLSHIHAHSLSHTHTSLSLSHTLSLSLRYPDIIVLGRISSVINVGGENLVSPDVLEGIYCMSPYCSKIYIEGQKDSKYIVAIICKPNIESKYKFFSPIIFTQKLFLLVTIIIIIYYSYILLLLLL